MIEIINDCLTELNSVGEALCTYAGGAFVQSALLVLLLFAIDLLLRKRVRAVVRYYLWLLVLVKLLLPPTLALPTGIGYWLGDRLPARSPVSEWPADAGGFDMAAQHRLERSEPSGGVSLVPPAPSAGESDAPVTPAVLRLTPITWQGLVLLFWLAGVLAFMALLAQRVRFVKGLVAGSAPASGELLRLLEQRRQQMGVRRPVGLRTLNAVSSPAVCGLFRPTILVPAPLVEHLSPEGLKATLIHELAHIKRGDLWINAVQTFLQVVYFYNPFVWFANAIIRRTCEEAVDETVLVTLGGQARDYSNTLIDIGEMAFWKADFGLRLVGVAESRKALKRRIKHMLTRPVPKSARIGALGTITILVVAAVLLPMAKAAKSSKEASATPQVTDAKATDKASGAGESDTIVDPTTGLKFTVAKKISGENDMIVNTNRLRLSPNGKFLLYKGQVVPLDGSKAFKLEALHGTEFAAWSSDGKLIAYLDKSAIWLLPASPEMGQPTGPARKLLDDQLNWTECEILWSHDSGRIFAGAERRGYQHRTISVQDGRLMQPPDYTRFSLRSPDEKSLAYFKPHNGVWTAPVEGGPSRLVAGFHGDFVPQSVTIPLWWSPDGQWLLCGRGNPGDNYNDLRFARLADHREVVLKFPKQIGYYALGVTPDDKKLQIYKGSYERRDVFKVAPISGGRLVELTFSRNLGYAWACGPFSPDGQRWFFLVDKPGIGGKENTWAPCVADSPTGDPVEIGLPEEVKREQAINYWSVDRWLLSPDGKRLLRKDEYVTTRGVLADFYVIPISVEEAQSTGPATLIFKECELGGGIVWSADSSRLAMAKLSEDGSRGLWVVPADGSPPKQLTRRSNLIQEWEEGWKWSPDGRFIAYNVHSRGSPGQNNLYVIPSEGGVPKRLWTKSGEDLGRYEWLPNRREIGLQSDDALVAIDVADGSVRPFLKLAEAGFDRLQWSQWSPDGRTLGLCGDKDGGDPRIALFHASDNRIEVLPDPEPGEKSYLHWTGDSQAIFYRSPQPKKVRPAGLIYEVDIEQAWMQAKNSVAGESSTASASPLAKSKAPPLVNGEFRDDFESGDTKYWTFEDDERSSKDDSRLREVQNGELTLENTRAVFGLPEWTNYVITVKMCIKRAGRWGVGFRRGEYGEYYLGTGLVNLKEGPWLGVRYPDADKLYRIGMVAEPSCDFVLDKWYTIQVEVKGPHIVVRVDGQPLVDVSDGSCPQGNVALISGPGTRVHFDDFSVRRLP